MIVCPDPACIMVVVAVPEVTGRDHLERERFMHRIFAAIALLTLAGTGVVGVSPAFADTWGCSSEKCLVSCAKSGGHNCSFYCDKALRDKKVSKVCK